MSEETRTEEGPRRPRRRESEVRTETESGPGTGRAGPAGSEWFTFAIEKSIKYMNSVMSVSVSNPTKGIRSPLPLFMVRS